MLMLFTWASLMFVAPPIVQSTTSVRDSTQAQQQDTVSRKKPDFSPKGSSPQERPPFRQNTSRNTFLSPQTNQQQFEGIADSLLRINPILRAPFLKELLIPSGPLAHYPPAAGPDDFNRQLAKDSRISTFERMGLIAKRYATYNPSDKSMKAYQVEIIRTIRWLSEALK